MQQDSAPKYTTSFSIDADRIEGYALAPKNDNDPSRLLGKMPIIPLLEVRPGELLKCDFQLYTTRAEALEALRTLDQNEEFVLRRVEVEMLANEPSQTTNTDQQRLEDLFVFDYSQYDYEEMTIAAYNLRVSPYKSNGKPPNISSKNGQKGRRLARIEIRSIDDIALTDAA